MDETYTITVRGPKGLVEVELPGNQVEFFADENSGDLYATALYLAYCDRWANT